jgi:hypothetical protein
MSISADTKRIAYFLAIVGACAVAVLLRAPAIAPSYLWLDDQWVAVLVRDASIRDLIRFAPPVPFPFVLLLKAIAAVFGDSPAALQAVPLLASLALVPATAALAQRITDSRVVAVTAAMFIAADPELARYSVRVKPFALDALATVLIAWVFVAAIRRPSGLALSRLGLLAAVSLLFSFATTISGAVFVHIAAFVAVVVVLRRRPIESPHLLWGALYACAIFDLVAFSVFAFTARVHPTATVFSYWKDFYLPLESVALAWNFLASKGVAVFAGTVPGLAARPTFALVCFGTLALVAKPRTRTAALSIVAVFGSLLIVSALEYYPAGGGRTDLFTHPLSAMLAAAGLYAMASSILPAAATSVRPATVALAGIAGISVIAAIAVIAVIAPSSLVSYPRAGDRDVIEHAAASLSPEDTVIIYPWSTWAVALYSGWPVHLAAEPSSTNGFYAVPDRPRTLILHEERDGASFLSSATVAASQLEEMLSAGVPSRIYLIATRTEERALAYIRDGLESHGYARASSYGHDRATFDVFELRTAADGTAPVDTP